jgi:pyochelin synthetase
MNSVSSELKIQIAPRKFVEAFPQLTINNLAKILAENIPLKTDEETGNVNIVDLLGGPIVPDHGQRYLPFDLTDIQYAYWIGQSGAMEWGNVPCHLFVEFDRNDSNFDLNRFNHAFQRVIERHEMLRAIVSNDAKQRLLRQVPPYTIEVLDMRGEPPDLVEIRLSEIRQRMSVHRFRHDQWPLFELRVSRFDGNRIRFHFNLDLLIFDPQSIQILYRDLAWYYDNPDDELAPLELSFRDYINAWAVVKETNLYKMSRDYWMTRFPALPAPPELPLVKNVTFLSDTQFASHAFELDPETWRRLKNRASQAGLTPSCFLLAAYTMVLSVWSKRPHFTLNLTQFNRHPLHPQVMDILGDFTSVLLVSVDRSGSCSFEARGRRIQEELWEAMEHRYFSGVEVMREMARRQQGKPFIVPYVFTSVTGMGVNIGEESQQELEEAIMGTNVFMASRTPQVILDHQIYERQGGLTCRWEVARDVFPDGLIGGMLDAYYNYLKRLADKEEPWHETTPGLIPAFQLERRAKVNATEAPVSSEMLHTLFAGQVVRQPDQPAVISSSRTLSYAELFHRSNQIGHLLQKKGAQPNTLVAVIMEKGWEQVAAVLGILQSGAAYLPVDPAIPKERLWHLLNDGEVNLALTQSWLAERLECPENLQCFHVDTMKTDKNVPPVALSQKPEDLAYVIYTSGSTGLPKGVMIDHRGAVNTILDVNRRFGVGPEDRVLALSNLNFDLSVYDIFGTLAAGGTVILPEAGKTKDPSHWIKLIRQNQVTIWNSVPTMMQMLTEYVSDRTGAVPQSLRLVLLSGDWVPLDLPDKIRALVNGVRVISLGGATEASIWSNLYPIAAVDPNWKSIPYGYPMANQRLYVLNEFMEDRPDWVPGQLYIGGIGLAKGYWGDEEKTQESFVIHPRTGERLYRTWDLGRYLPDTNIEFLGREDFQVKIGGHRIELGEIEAVLKQHPRVKDAVAVAAGDPKRKKHIWGYAVPSKGKQISRDELQGFLKEKLAEYMIPSALVILDALPMTPNGKVNRNALPAPENNLSEPEAPYVAPRNKLEQTIAAVVQEVLEIERASIQDKFFDMGADSVQIIRIQSKLAGLLQQDIPVLALFEHSTISDLAQFLDNDMVQDDSFTQIRKRVEARKAKRRGPKQVPKSRKSGDIKH